MHESRTSAICRTLGWLTAKLVLLLLLTGYGVTSFQVVTPLTLGLLTKPVAQQLHEVLVYPLLVVLVLHLAASILSRRSRARAGETTSR